MLDKINLIMSFDYKMRVHYIAMQIELFIVSREILRNDTRVDDTFIG